MRYLIPSTDPSSPHFEPQRNRPGPVWAVVEYLSTLPMLTSFQTPSGERLVWTSFSTDQIDLNFAHPQVLLEVLGALLFYLQNGAQLICLGAVGFIWKAIGTSCIHLPTMRACKKAGLTAA